ncbi:MAG TPA: hypothetical protein VFX19_07290, partial [Dehalococcoidia bacterium]|nr:hypothetical protein [Dehalococcoidia bacterium]
MRANWRAIWDLGEVAYRYEVLHFVYKHVPARLWALCWEALEAEDYEGMLHGLALAHLLLPSRTRKLTDEQLEVLVRTVRTEKSVHTRMF